MDPILVEVTRGNRVESAHRGAAAVIDAAGAALMKQGPPAAVVRSAHSRDGLAPFGMTLLLAAEAPAFR